MGGVLKRAMPALGAGGFPCAPLLVSPSTLIGYWTAWDLEKLFTDAGTTKVANDGDLAYQMSDKGAGGRNWTQATAGLRAPITNAGANGLPYLDFNATPNQLYMSHAGFAWPSGGSFSVFAVAAVPNTASIKYLVGSAAGGVDIRFTAAEKVNYVYAGITDEASSAQSVSTSGASFVVGTYNTTTFDVYIDSNSAESLATSEAAPNANVTNLCASNAITLWGNLKLYELALYSNVLSSGQIGFLRNYSKRLYLTA